MERGTNFEDFEALVGQEFRASLDGSHVVVRLVVAKLSAASAAIVGGRIPFRLEFETLEAVTAPQATYEMEGPDGITRSIFAVPVGKTKSGGTLLEAIFA